MRSANVYSGNHCFTTALSSSSSRTHGSAAMMLSACSSESASKVAEKLWPLPLVADLSINEIEQRRHCDLAVQGRANT